MKKSLVLTLSAVAVMLLGGSRSEASLTVSFAFSNGGTYNFNDTGTPHSVVTGPQTDGGSLSSFSGTFTSNDGLPGVANLTGLLNMSTFSTNQLIITITENAYTLANFPGGKAGDPYGNVYTTIVNNGSPNAAISGTIVTTATAATTGTTYTLPTSSPNGSTTYMPTPFTSSAGLWTITTTITFNSTPTGGVAGFQFNDVAATPAPSALLLAGLGLPIFGFMRRGFRARKSEPTNAA